jgi:hypothetical protein
MMHTEKPLPAPGQNKANYTPPVLQVYGTLAEITARVGNTGKSDKTGGGGNSNTAA